MFSGDADREPLSENTALLPANSITLNRSSGRSDGSSSSITDLLTSSGKPFIDPDTSRMNTYSLGTTCSTATRSGGSTISRKKPSSSPG